MAQNEPLRATFYAETSNLKDFEYSCSIAIHCTVYFRNKDKNTKKTPLRDVHFFAYFIFLCLVVLQFTLEERNASALSKYIDTMFPGLLRKGLKS